MARKITATAIAALLMAQAPALALGEGLQCVPYARQLTGIQIYGDAHSWWDQAEGRYARGTTPQVGAVMAFRPFGNMQLGHVAAVSKILDNRRLLISHANWSTFDGTRGHVENDVLVVDASEHNDWSQVRVWYGTNQALGTTLWPLAGFIYPRAPKADESSSRRFVAAPSVNRNVASDRSLFGKALRDELARVAAKEAPRPPQLAPPPVTPQKTVSKQAYADRQADPIGDLISRTMR